MKIGDRIKTTAWLDVMNDNDYLYGEIKSINDIPCFDGSIFEKIYVRFDDGRILPCIREELEVIS